MRSQLIEAVCVNPDDQSTRAVLEDVLIENGGLYAEIVQSKRHLEILSKTDPIIQRLRDTIWNCTELAIADFRSKFPY